MLAIAQGVEGADDLHNVAQEAFAEFGFL